MLRSTKRSGLFILVWVALIVTAVVAVGCSSGDESTTTSSGSATAVTAGPSEPQRLVVGGKTAEEYEAALPDLQQAVEEAPDDLAALQELAIAQYNTGRYEEAAATYQKMLELNDDAFTRNNYGNVLRDWKKLDEAKAEYEKAIATDPALVTAYVNLASVLAAEGDVAEALVVLNRGIEATTGDDKERLENMRDRLSGASSTTEAT